MFDINHSRHGRGEELTFSLSSRANQIGEANLQRKDMTRRMRLLDIPSTIPFIRTDVIGVRLRFGDVVTGDGLNPPTARETEIKIILLRVTHTISEGLAPRRIAIRGV